MSWTTYTTVNGQILHQEKDGVGTHLIPDTLGNIIATIDDAGTVTSQTEYLPYGEVESQSGTHPTPFGFVGAWGYYSDSEATTYIRARTYSPVMAAWVTSDPLWPNEMPYVYSDRPVSEVDPSGLFVVQALCIGACAGAAGCLGGLAYACHNWDIAYDSWGDCAAEFLQSLPPHSLVGCATALVGCIACVARYARNCYKEGRCTPAQWKAYSKAIHNKAACDGKRSCENLNKKRHCPEIKQRLARAEACVIARLVRQLACYKSDQMPSRHFKEIFDAQGVMLVCLRKLVEKGCT